MLGHGKITFETPNVIDPGETPPCRPCRLESTTYSDNPDLVIRERPNPNYTDLEDRRKSYQSTRTRTVKINLATEDGLPADPNIDERSLVVDNGDYGVAARGEHRRNTHNFNSPKTSPSRGEHSQLTPTSSEVASPTMEDARLFATSLIAEAERLKRLQRNDDDSSMRSSSSMRWPRRGRRHEFPGLRGEAQSDPEDIEETISLRSREGFLKRQTRCRMRCLRAFIVLTALLLVLGFSIPAYRASKSQPSQPMQQSDLDRLDRTIKVLIQYRISKQVHLEDRSSPQYQAAYWITIEDAEQLDIPIDSDPSSFRFFQRYVLAVLYFSWNGPAWNNQLKFVSDLHECSWFESIPDESGIPIAIGVTCDKYLQVRNLVLASNNIEGQIPEEIIHLTKLDLLSLNHNALTGSIPHYLKQLPLLDFLDLKYNQLTGTIPEFLGNLTRLEVLGLSHNQFTGQVPVALGSLRLKTLAIDDNLLTGDLSSVALMRDLRYLYADNNNFKGRLENDHLANLIHLVEIDLSGNELEATSIPPYVLLHPTLRVVDLHGNRIAGTIPDDIPQNMMLEYLSLRGNALSSSIPTQIRNLRALTHLDLEANALTGTLPAEDLAQMTNLSYLFLGKNTIQSGTIPDAFHTLRSLRELSLDSLQLTGSIPVWIENLSQLKLLDLRSNALTGTIPINFSNLHQLRYVMLSDNRLSGLVPKSWQSNLLVVALHQNNFTGDASLLCDLGVQLLTVDCGSITCPCCGTCCDGQNCYEDMVWDVLENSQGLWEENFQRSNYGFDPQILYATTTSSGKDGQQ